MRGRSRATRQDQKLKMLALIPSASTPFPVLLRNLLSPLIPPPTRSLPTLCVAPDSLPNPITQHFPRPLRPPHRLQYSQQ